MKFESQRKWIEKQKSEGRCIVCGKPAVNKNHCALHRDKSREWQRKRYAENKALREQAKGVV